MATIVGSGADVENVNAWTNPGNVTAVDGVYATMALAITPSDTLRCTMAGNAFSIASAATGIFVELLCHQGAGGTAVISLAKLVQGGTELGADQSGGALAVPTSDTWVGIGGSTNTWGNGASIAAATVNSSTFGVDLQVSGGATDEVFIDAVRITPTASGGVTESSELIAARMCICG